jgi:hypothetical protein
MNATKSPKEPLALKTTASRVEDRCRELRCGYRAQDMIDDDIGDNFNELSIVINNPSAEGFFTAVKTSVVNSPPP